jgi:hypothetical protein
MLEVGAAIGEVSGICRYPEEIDAASNLLAAGRGPERLFGPSGFEPGAEGDLGAGSSHVHDHGGSPVYITRYRT